MKTSLWRSANQLPDAASLAIMEFLDYELARIVPCIEVGDAFSYEMDALFEAALSLMQIQLSMTRDVPTCLVEFILGLVVLASAP